MKRVPMRPRTKPMKRGDKPLKNGSGWHPTRRKDVDEVASVATPRYASAEYRYGSAQVPALFKPIEKHEYVRSPALMALYRLPPCQYCGSYDGVCGAHSNWAIHGKGKSIKADDNRCASLCVRCHHDLDQGGTLTDGQRKSMWWPAHVRTIRWIVVRKMWPAGVPIPSLEVPEEWL